jgi:hypothetical protein
MIVICRIEPKLLFFDFWQIVPPKQLHETIRPKFVEGQYWRESLR